MNNLEFYKDFLDKGTEDGQDWHLFSEKPKSRYDT